jgi:hypothetical protein
MGKFIVLPALLFLAGFTASVWAAADIGGYAATRNLKCGKDVQSTQGDQGQVAGKLKGQDDAKSIDGGGIKAQSAGRKLSAKNGKAKVFSNKKESKLADKLPGTMGDYAEKGEEFGKGKMKGFRKNQGVAVGAGKTSKLQEKINGMIDGEVQRGKGIVSEGNGKTGKARTKMALDGKDPRKGFLKNEAQTGKGGNQAPAAK